jgi:hypothetical protein
MGKATVDILLPNIDIDEPTIRTRKAGELESRARAVRDLPANLRKTGKWAMLHSPSVRLGSGPTVFAAFSALASAISAKIPLPSR